MKKTPFLAILLILGMVLNSCCSGECCNEPTEQDLNELRTTLKNMLLSVRQDRLKYEPHCVESGIRIECKVRVSNGEPYISDKNNPELGLIETTKNKLSKLKREYGLYSFDKLKSDKQVFRIFQQLFKFIKMQERLKRKETDLETSISETELMESEVKISGCEAKKHLEEQINKFKNYFIDYQATDKDMKEMEQLWNQIN